MRRIIGSLGLVPILLLVFASSVLAARPSTGFTGTWEGIDPGDGSNVVLSIAGAKTVQGTLSDDVATNACAGASSAEFEAHLVGKVYDGVMITVIENAKCGTEPRPFFRGLTILWFLDEGDVNDPFDDVLYNTFDEIYTRVS